MKSYQDGIHTKIDINTNLTKKRAKLFLELTNKPLNYKINFLHVSIVSHDIIERLVKILENREKDSLIIVSDKLLSKYFHELRIKHKTIFEPMHKHANTMYDVLVIGGSENSLDKIIELLIEIKIENKIAFVLLHHAPSPLINLASFLSERTNKTIVYAQHSTKVEKGTIYVAPPNYHLLIKNGIIILSDTSPFSYAKPSIDLLFESLSYEYGSSLLAILLCGNGFDGSNKLKEITKRGVTVAVLDPEECRVKAMVLSALKTKCFNFKFTMQELIFYLQNRFNTIHTSNELLPFLKALEFKYGYDFSNYSKDSVNRRIYNTMQENHFDDYNHFTNAVLHNKRLFKKLFANLSINVTSFFREAQTLKFVRDNILTDLSNYAHINVWSAGCSTGQEAYTIAILLQETKILDKSLIYATDFNQHVIDIGKNALYSSKDIKNAEDAYIASGGINNIERYFNKIGNFLSVKDNLHKNTLFFTHNLVTDSKFNQFEIIFCRNVLIYFEHSLQIKTLQLFYDSLTIDGFLVLSKSETAMIDGFDKLFKIVNNNFKVYQKVT